MESLLSDRFTERWVRQRAVQFHPTTRLEPPSRRGAAGLEELHRWLVTAHRWSAALHAGAGEPATSCWKSLQMAGG